MAYDTDPVDAIAKMRRMRLFNSSSLQPTTFDEESTNTEQEDYQTPMLDRYKLALDEMPDRNNYKSSLIRKLLAGSAGVLTGIQEGPARGIALAEDVIDAPYNRDADRWGKRVNLLGKQAEIESEGNTNRFKRYIDTAKLNEDVVNNQSLRKYRETQGTELQDRIRSRSPEALDQASNRIFGREASLIPLREGSTIRTQTHGSNLIEGRNNRARPLDEASRNRNAAFSNDLNIRSGLELDRNRTDSDIRAHSTNRLFDVANPTANFNIQPSQEDNATNAAVKNVMLSNPEYGKFKDPDTGSLLIEDSPEFRLFTQKVEAEKKRIIRQASGRNPLTNDTNSVTVNEDAANHFKANGVPNPTPADIEWLAKQPKPW